MKKNSIILADNLEALVAEARAVAGVATRPRIQFGSYGVVGNLIILCELEMTVCENLADALPQGRTGIDYAVR